MADRASVFELVAVGAETTAGTAIVPTRQLASLKVTPSVNLETSQFKPAGYKWNTTSVLNKEWTASDVSGVADFREIVYPLCSVFKTVTPTTPGGGTNSRNWTIAPTTSSADTPKSYTVWAGSEIRAERSTYGLFDSFGVKYTRGSGIEVSGSLISQKTLDDKVRYLRISGTPTGGTFTITIGANTTAGIAYNASAATVQTAITGLASVGSGNATVASAGALPSNILAITFTGTFDSTELPTIMTVSGASLTGGTSPAVTITRTPPAMTATDVKPVVPTQVQIRTATTQAGLAAGTILTRVLECEWKAEGRWGPIWTLNRAEGSWAAPIETEPTGTVTLKVGADEAGMAFLNNIRAGSTSFLQVDATSTEAIEGTIYWQFTTQIAVKWTEVSSKEDQDGLVSVTWTGTFTHDSTWGRAIECVVVNDVTAL